MRLPSARTSLLDRGLQIEDSSGLKDPLGVCGALPTGSSEGHRVFTRPTVGSGLDHSLGDELARLDWSCASF